MSETAKLREEFTNALAQARDINSRDLSIAGALIACVWVSLCLCARECAFFLKRATAC